MGRKVISGGHGKEGRVFVNGQEMCVEEWSGSEIAVEEEVTNSCGAGFEDFEYGTTHFEGSFTAIWDAQVNIYDDPPDLRAANVVALQLYINSDSNTPDGPFWDFPTVGISSVEHTTPAKGAVKYTVNFKSKGSYTRPTGVVSSSGV